MVQRLALELGLTPKFVEDRSHRASYEYKEYRIPKRAGGYRTIHQPSRALKAFQRWLLVNVINELPVHPAAFAYRKDCSIFDNARVHSKSRYLLRMDLHNFFPSIKEADLRKYIGERPALFADWTFTDVTVFCSLVCRDGELTIGAPTSPALSNAICYDMDVRINDVCAKAGVTYSRYADDLFFSTDRRDVLRQIQKDVEDVISQIHIPADLRLNPSKTRHSSKRGRRQVTGIVLGSDNEIHISRAFKRKIRALLHRFSSLTAEQQASLAGMIAYVIGFEPDFMNRIISKYGLPLVREAMSRNP